VNRVANGNWQLKDDYVGERAEVAKDNVRSKADGLDAGTRNPATVISDLNDRARVDPMKAKPGIELDPSAKQLASTEDIPQSASYVTSEKLTGQLNIHKSNTNVGAQKTSSQSKRGERESTPSRTSTRPPILKKQGTRTKKNNRVSLETPPKKMARFEKKMILFPDLAAKKREDEYLAEFEARADGDPFREMKQIEPEELDYNYPDFGFNNEL